MKKRFLATLTAIALSVAGLTTTVALSITAYAAGDNGYSLEIKKHRVHIGYENGMHLSTIRDNEHIKADYVVEKVSDSHNIIKNIRIEEADLADNPRSCCYFQIRDDADPMDTAILRVISKSTDGAIVYDTRDVEIKLSDEWLFYYSDTDISFTEEKAEEKTITAKTDRKTNKIISYEWKIVGSDNTDIGDEAYRFFELSGANTPSVTVKYNGGHMPREYAYYDLQLKVKVDGEIVKLYGDTVTINVKPNKKSTAATDNSKEIDNKAAQTPASKETPVLKSGEKVTAKTGESLKASKDGKSVVITKTSGKKSVKVPDKVVVNGVEYPVTELGKKAITGKKVKNVTINATNLTKINAKAFLGAKNLKTVKIVGVSKNSSIAKKIIKAAKKANKNVKIVFSKLKSNQIK